MRKTGQYLNKIPLFGAYLPLIALILPYVPYSPHICILLLRLHPGPVQNFRAIGPLFMEILHFEDLGDTNVVWLRTQLF